MYNHLNYFFKFSVKEISIKNKSSLKGLSKGFKLKSFYTTKGENNIEMAYEDLVFNDKKIDDVIYKKLNNETSDRNKDIFQEAKKLFDLRVEIYKKLVLEEKNLKFEKSVGETVKLRNQKDKKFIEHIENKSKTINYNLFKEYFNFESPTVLTKQLYKIKKKKKNNESVNVIKSGLIDLKDEHEKMSEDEKETKKPDKILEIVEKILIFNKENREQQGLGLKILTPNQML